MTDLSKLVKVKGLIWIGPDNNGGFYAPVDLSADFSAYYTIEQCDYGLATVEYGVHCHEFGSTVIWKGPKDQAKAAAQADYTARVMAVLEPTELVVELVEALRPFAACADELDAEREWDDEEWAKFRLLVKHYRAARATLAKLGE